ncbi:LiaF transmembrane domain-containing protein [Acetivibrio cellulolyticus]|uniref:LiaF transmembrane domain-containing protein n=1 Tax=Acetivibrio cellulolyticus TaxID=35830 RepID=UPI0001E2E6A2|nr:DUF5668 domain-containing protein [Acetivibrio cellulolyticus]
MRQWRVGTLSMGLILIALGIIMWVSQISGISVIEHIVKWWPVVLIILGIEVLVYIFLSKQEEPKVKFDIFSIIIISIIMMASIGTYAVTSLISSGHGSLSINSMFDNHKYESKFKKNLSVDANSSNLVVSNANGDVEVVKGEGKKIDVEANITINNSDEAYAGKIAQSLVEIIDKKDIRISSKADQYSNKGTIGYIRIDYLIKVPDTVNVEVDNKFGDVALKDIALSGNVRNNNGDITVKSIGGTLKVNNSFGDIEINDIKGAATVSNTNGEIRGSRIGSKLTVINNFGDVIFSQVSGSIDVEGGNGAVEITGVGEDVKVTNKFGDIKVLNANKSITLSGSNGNISLETEKIIEKDVNIENKFGDIYLKVSGSQNGNIDASTQFGSVASDFGIAVNEDVNKETMKGTLTDDKIKFKVSNGNGDINIEKFK